MNKHIELVKKWLENKDSVFLEELEANAKAAAAAANAAANAAFGAAMAAAAAYYDYAADDDAAYWIKRFEELTK